MYWSVTCIGWETAELPVCEGSDDETWSVSKILVWVKKLSVTDVNETVPVLFIPAVSELRKPLEGLWGGDLWKHMAAFKLGLSNISYIVKRIIHSLDYPFSDLEEGTSQILFVMLF